MARTREGWLEEGRMEHCHLPEPGLLARKEAYYRCCFSSVLQKMLLHGEESHL